jgi:hypothetical protein
MPERIFLTYTNATAVPYEGTELGHHVVLNYIDSDGVHHTLQGVPEPVWGLPDNSDASGENDWFKFLAGMAASRPT